VFGFVVLCLDKIVWDEILVLIRNLESSQEIGRIDMERSFRVAQEVVNRDESSGNNQCNTILKMYFYKTAVI